MYTKSSFFTLEWLQIHEIIFEFEYQGRQK